MRIKMKLRYRLFQRSNGLFFIEDRVTAKQATPTASSCGMRSISGSQPSPWK
jgi:hypothetical protein